MKKNFVDLTVPIVTGHFRYPNFIRPFRSIAEGDSVNVTYYDLRSHWFTHIDSPRHFVQDGKTLDDFDVSMLIGRASILDVSHVGANQGITPAHLQAALEGCESTNFLIIKTAWGEKVSWESPKFWDEAPYMTREAAEFIRDLHPKVVGFDFPQDHDIRLLKVKDESELDMTTHEIILKNDILMVEYLNYLWKVPVQNVDIYALPLNLKQADGAQIRVVVSF